MWRSISITVFIIFCGVSLPSVAQEQKDDTLSFRVFQAWQAWKPYKKPVEQPAKKEGKKKQRKNREKGVDTVRTNEEIGQKARFMSIDPLWEKYRSWTPYQYAANNPLMYIDPVGFPESAPLRSRGSERQDDPKNRLASKASTS